MRAANPYQRIIFGDRLAERDRIIQICETSSRKVPTQVAKKLESCCRQVTLHADLDDTNIRIAQQRCKSRLCPSCTKLRSARLIAKTLPIVMQADNVRFVTLTQRHSDAPLQTQIKQLTKSFATLRRSKIWRQYVVGGLYTIEVVWSPDSNAWHPHIHALVDGQFFPQRQLRDAWSTANGGSHIVDIRQVRSRRNAVNYVAKYVTKAAETKGIPAHAIEEWAEALHGLRMAQTFGTMHACKPDEETDDEPFPAFAATLGPVLLAADDGDADALRLIAHVAALANRRLPHGDANAAQEHDAKLASALGRVRSYLRSAKETDDAFMAAKRNIRSRNRGSPDRTERLWKDDGPPARPVGLPD